MTLNTVTLTWDFTDALQAGDTAFLQAVPTNPPWTNAAGMTIVTGEPLTQDFTGGPGSLAGIIANDNTLTPASQGYEITVKKADGTVLYDQTVVLNHSAGATQDLSSLTPAGQIGVVTPYLLAANDLSDVDDAATALANLGGVDAAAVTTAIEDTAFPLAQTVATVDATFADLFSIASTGSTDPLGPFELATGGRALGGILNQVYYLGYNALQGASKGSSANGSATINFWTDAGDTNSSGRHGVETNISWFGPAGTTATGAFQMVAVNDDTNTVNTTIRCGSGTSGGIASAILFTNGDATTTFCTMSDLTSNITFNVPATFQAATGNNSFLIEATGGTSAAILTLEGNNGSAVSAELLFAKFGVGTAWNINYTAPNLIITDSLNSRSAIDFLPGTTATAEVLVNSKLLVLGSVICNNAALATTATTGFLYLPSCPGPPTGTPVTQTGTVPCVADSTDGKIYFFIGGSWKAVTPA